MTITVGACSGSGVNLARSAAMSGKSLARNVAASASAKVAAAKLAAGTDEAAFYQAKLSTARFFIERILPQAAPLLAGIKAGKASMMAMEDAAF